MYPKCSAVIPDEGPASKPATGSHAAAALSIQLVRMLLSDPLKMQMKLRGLKLELIAEIERSIEEGEYDP